MIQDKTDLKKYLEEDAKSLNWKFQRLLRKTEYHFNNNHKIRYLFLKVRLNALSTKLGFTIPLNVFGPGLSIAHRGTIVVNGHAKIGSNCRIHVCVNIGASATCSTAAPTIGDNCYIGPGAKLYGDILLGEHVAIGANSVVNKSFPDGHCIVAGVPAKIISNKHLDRNIE